MEAGLKTLLIIWSHFMGAESSAGISSGYNGFCGIKRAQILSGRVTVHRSPVADLNESRYGFLGISRDKYVKGKNKVTLFANCFYLNGLAYCTAIHDLWSLPDSRYLDFNFYVTHIREASIFLTSEHFQNLWPAFIDPVLGCFYLCPVYAGQQRWNISLIFRNVNHDLNFLHYFAFLVFGALLIACSTRATAITP